MGHFSLTQFLTGEPSSSHKQQPPHQINPNTTTLTFRPSPFDQDATLIERANPDYTTSPLFSITSPKKSKHVEIYRIGAHNHPIPPTLIGSSRYSSMKASTEVTLNGQPLKLSSSNSADGYTFKLPPNMVKMKWKTKMSGALVLRDEQTKQELAKYDSEAGFKRAKAAKFEVLVPADDYLLDVIVVTGMAAVKMYEKDKSAIEMMGEVVGGLAGA